MEWVIAAIIVACIGLAVLAGTGALGQLRPEPVRDVYRQPMPGRPLTAADLDAVRFGVTVRGYSMAQVDDLLDRLRDDLVTLEAELARWRSGSAGAAATPYGTVPSPYGALPEAEPDPFAEYDLDGGQGVPEGDPWYDGDGRPNALTETEPVDSFPQWPAGQPDQQSSEEERR